MAEAVRSRTESRNRPIAANSRAVPGARQLVAPRKGTAAPLKRTGSFRPAIALGSQRRMAEYRVIGVEVRDSRRSDPHVAVLCLEDGRRVPKLRAMSNIRYGVEAYFAEDAGARLRLRVVDPCSRCGEAYLRADGDATMRDRLMNLPPCPPLTAAPAKPRRERL
jgi:hypothetical protein